MVVVGLFQFGLTNAAYGHKYKARFPPESIPGVKKDWDRMESKCYAFLMHDIGNTDLFDIHRALQKQNKHCKRLVTSGTSIDIDEVEACHSFIEAAFKQCKDASTMPECQGELKTEILLSSKI